MKKIGYIDYYLDEYHAHQGFKSLKVYNEKNGTDFAVTAVYAEKDCENGMTTDEFCAKYGIEKCASIAELGEKVDYLIILSPDNSEKKLGYAKQAFLTGKPTFLDKTFTDSYASALEICEASKKTGTPFFSASPLRYADELNAYMGTAKSILVMGSGVDLKDYAVHYLEIIMATMGVGVKQACWEQRANQEWMHLEYADGRKATAAISMNASYLDFVMFVADKDGDSAIVPITSDIFANQMAGVLNFFTTGEVTFAKEQTLELMKVRDAILKSKAEAGVWVQL